MHTTYERLVQFKETQRKFVADAEFRRRTTEIQELQDKIKKLQKFECKKCEPTILRTLLVTNLNTRTLKQICIDYFNLHGPQLLSTVLHVDWPTLTTQQQAADEKAFEACIDSYLKSLPRSKQGKFVKSSFGVRRLRGNFDNGESEVSETDELSPPRPPPVALAPTSHETTETTLVAASETQPPVITTTTDADQKKLKRKWLEEQAANSEKRVLRTVTGATQRVTYVDDIPDDVLFFGQQKTTKRRRLLEEKAILQSIKEAQKTQDVINVKLDKQADMKTQVSGGE